MTALFRWSHPLELHGMASPETLREQGYEPVGVDPRYPDSQLWRKRLDDDDARAIA